MARESPASNRTKCLNCGFESTGDDWGSVEHPTLGALTQCPECGSTDTTMIGSG